MEITFIELLDILHCIDEKLDDMEDELRCSLKHCDAEEAESINRQINSLLKIFHVLEERYLEIIERY